MLDYKKLKKFGTCPYHVDMGWDFIFLWLEKKDEQYGVELNPDFQRGHVWTEKQQTAYIEFILKGGQSGKEIYFNHPNWMGSFEGNLQLVDGLQRITAVRKFLNNEVPVFDGYYYKDIENISLHDLNLAFSLHVNNLKTRKEVLEWYVFMNSGVAHTQEELDRVKNLIKEEK
jgi:uncharacterized protein with ParB-like and HNH nuclease domain